MNDIMIKPINEQLMNAVISKWLGQTPADKKNITQDKTDSTVFSLEKASTFTEGNAALALELIHMLKLELPEYQIKIASALESKNYTELKSQVHKLHGASRCCGTPALCSAAAHMEQLIDNKSQHDVLATAANKLSHEISRLLEISINDH